MGRFENGEGGNSPTSDSEKCETRGRFEEFLGNEEVQAHIAATPTSAAAALPKKRSSENKGEADKKKRGRPPLWVPRKLSAADEQQWSAILEEYAPRTQQAQSFEAKYLEFCVINNLEPTKGLMPAIAQARQDTAAWSSLKTDFGTLIKRMPFGRFADEFVASATLTNGKADSDPVQPRTVLWTKEDIEKCFAAIPEDTPISHETLTFLTAVTGNRACNVRRLRPGRVRLGTTFTEIQWSWRKVSKTKDTVRYPFAWSVKPSSRVKEYLSRKNWSLPTKPPADQIVTSTIRKASGSLDVTSYVFRDYHEAMHRKRKTSPEEYRLLMDHNEHTGRTSYTYTKLDKDRIQKAKKAKVESRKKKAADVQAKVKASAKKIAKRSSKKN